MTTESHQRVLVTGGSGFIGTHLVSALRSTGREVLNFDVSPPNLPEHTPLWRQIDLLDREAFFRHIKSFQPSTIYNLAATTDISVGAEKLAVNTDGLKTIIDAARSSAEPIHLIHTSTQLVVGPKYLSAGPRDYAPYTAYGASKARSEELLWDAEADFIWTIVRPTTVWGPWHPSFATSTWRYIGKRWYMLPSRPDPMRCYGYVGNVVAQLLAVIERPVEHVRREVFYVGDEPVRSSAWLDGFSRAMTGKPVRRIPGDLLRLIAEFGEISGKFGGPSPINRGRLYRMTTDYIVPMAGTFEVLGRGPYTFDEGVKASLAWLALTGTELSTVKA